MTSEPTSEPDSPLRQQRRTAAVRPDSRRARRVRSFRPAALVAGAVLVLGAGLTACEGGAALCLDDDSCEVVVHTDSAESTRSVEVFSGGRKLNLTVGRITDSTVEIKLGNETKTFTEDVETTIGPARITLRSAHAKDRAAEFHVVR
ncbi:hypothetical protein ACFCX4_16035 [Kitasatospora sp. NPDC056327]|uniref:hypothetical protein n=1 Tax=Kitasatospora sp. NPDC056327 TaxID=3345785 RepID=UPI0035DB0DDF